MTQKNIPFEAFKYKEFSYFISARFLLTLALVIQFLTVEWFVYSVTKSPLHLGLIALAEIIPAIVFSLISGHIIDKNEKKTTSVLLSIVLFIITIGFFLTLKFHNNLSKNTLLFLLYFLVFCFGIVRAFFSPAVFSLFALILPKKVYANGTVWNSSAWQIGNVIGPALAGFLYAFIGGANSMLISGIFVLICIILLSLIEKKQINYIKSDSIIDGLSQGFKFIFNNKIILNALCLDLFAVLFGGAISLLPIFLQDEIIPFDSYSNIVKNITSLFNYNMNKEQIQSFAFGVLRSAPAIGAIITMITIAYIPIKNKTGIKLLFSVLAFGISIILFGISKSFYFSFFILLFSGIADGVSVVIRQTILQVLTPDDMRGRVAAINTIFIGSSNELGAFESGITAKLFGATRAVILGGTITIAVVISTFLIFPKMKKFELK